MPLAFTSASHGTVAFGFFNIQSHMLLLDRAFFFADDFCGQVGKMAGHGKAAARKWTVYRFEDASDIGDLMGAINGVRFTGFLGDVYRRFPFPPRPEDFKQNPEGDCTRAVIVPMIEAYAARTAIAVSTDAARTTVSIGDYRFDRDGFQALVRYVWQGGYPRWRDDRPPGYVRAMRQCIDGAPGPLFHGMQWE